MMMSKRELQQAITEFEGAQATSKNCQTLAALYTIYDHCYSDVTAYSAASAPQDDGIYYSGNSEFAATIKGMKQDHVWSVMEELMETLKIVNRRLYDGVMRKLDT